MQSESGQRTRRFIGGVLSPAAFALVLYVDLPLEQSAHRLAAIFAAVLIAWLTEVVPIAFTALLIAPLLVLTGVTSAKEAFKHYADPLLYLFVGGFFIAEAMRHHALDRQIAQRIVGLPFVRGQSPRVRVALVVAGALLSMWISNTAATAILVPIFLSTIGAQALSGERRKGASGTLLALAYGCSVGGLGTLVGSPPNLITARSLEEAGTSIDFLGWMAIGVPTALVVGVAVHLITRSMLSSDDTVIDPAERETELPYVRGLSGGRLVTAIAFGAAALLWLLPGVSRALGLSFADDLKRLLHPGVVALLAASLLFVVHVKDAKGSTGPVLPWKKAMQIDWGVILLFGGGIALGAQMVETGLASAIARGFLSVTGISSLWTLTGVAALFTIFFTEVCSNTASATMLAPLVVSMSTELGVSPIPPTLAVGLAASCAFMLPIATGPNAIVYSTGHIRQTEMLKTGLILNLVSVVVVVGVLRLLCPLYGWI